MKPHGTDTVSLIAGLLFTTLGAIWLVDAFAGLSLRTAITGFGGAVLLSLIIAVVRLIVRPRSPKS